MASPAADQRFWAPQRAIFDFSLTFEQVVMEILPSAIVIAFSPLVYFKYRKEPVYVRSSPLLWAKLVMSSMLVITESVSLAFKTLPNEFQTTTSVPAASVELVAALTIGAIILLEHRRALRTSSLLALYLLLGLLIDITKSRSYFLRSGNNVLAALAATTGFLRLGLFLLEEKSRRSLLIEDELRENASPEATSTFMSRTFFLFLVPMLVTGYQKELNAKNLISLGLDFSSRLMHTTLGGYWSRVKHGSSKYGLMISCIRAWKYQILQMFVAQLAATAFLFAQPLLLQRIVDLIEKDSIGPEAEGERAGLLGATVLIFVGSTLAQTAAAHLSNRVIMQIRGGLTTHIIEKTHSLTEQEAQKSAAMSLMSTDADEIVTSLSDCISLPIMITEVGLSTVFLYYFIGYSFVFVIPPVILSSAASYFLGKWIQPASADWNQSIESRVAKTSQILAQLPTIKMLGLGPTATKFVQKLRIDEVDVSKRYYGLVSLAVPVVLFADIMTPVIVVAGAFFWRGFDGQVTAAKVFPTLAVVGLIQNPLTMALRGYPNLMAMIACFDRIQTFLRLEDRQDSRKKGAKAPAAAPIQFSNTSFGPRGMDDPLLLNVDISLTRGSVTSLLGRTGSGKSTMLSGVLGETKNKSGSIQVDATQISYCSQKPWLRDTTIRANIIGYLPYDEAKFNKVVKACQLELDLEQLPNGDEFPVGTDGQNLSGGQRQRVAIARSAYAEFPVTILDDPFSSLDRKTAVSVMHALCGEDGILRQAGSTVLLVTYLSESLEVVDDFIFLDDTGKVIMGGQDVQASPHAKAINELLSSASACQAEEKQLKGESCMGQNLQLGNNGEAVTDRQLSIRQKGDIGLYVLFIDAMGRGKSALFGLLVFFLSAGEMFPEIYMRMWIETDPDNALYFVGYASIAAATCLLGGFIYTLTYNKLGGPASLRLHEQLLDTTMSSTLEFLSTTKTGVLLNYFSQDATIFSRRLPSFMMRTLYVLYTLIILIGVILSGASYLTVSLPFVVAAIYFIQHFYLRTSRQLRHLDLEQRAPLFTFLRESAEGLLCIQSAGWQKQNIEAGFRLLDNSQQPAYLLYCIQRWLGLVTGLLTAAVAILLVGVTIYVRNSASGSQFGLAFLGLLVFNKTLLFFIDAFTQMETASGAISRLKQFKEQTPQEPKQSLVALPAGWPATGHIEIENLTARYSGKSSTLLSILGFLPHSGTIKIDGIDITSIAPDILRSRLVTITQENVQFKATVRTNLLPFTMNDPKDTTDEKKKADALKKDAELQVLLERLNIWKQLEDKGGLAAMLEDVGYSQGELQMLCIVRALVRQRELGTKVVLVDEATSRIDTSMDETVRTILEEAFKDCTVLTIAHREDTIRNSDRTIELSKGKIVNA
ncbi:hypothetical protein NLG97_g2553 [Lecanicillium saksenae]|uniref:Uncharacterized protein n=1 Tax=Lecanicillium saksenae TaxID=468837 RepID=A0ACC1R0J3_9HYPO|nr:hypothetical protein NLG97_g2553 [Lecanicillium saksenae]